MPYPKSTKIASRRITNQTKASFKQYQQRLNNEESINISYALKHGNIQQQSETEQEDTQAVSLKSAEEQTVIPEQVTTKGIDTDLTQQAQSQSRDRDELSLREEEKQKKGTSNEDKDNIHPLNIGKIKNIDLSDKEITQFTSYLYDNITDGRDIDGKSLAIMKEHIKDAMDKTLSKQRVSKSNLKSPMTEKIQSRRLNILNKKKVLMMIEDDVPTIKRATSLEKKNYFPKKSESS